MKLVEFVPPVRHPLWRLCLQMGISDVIVKVNPDLTGLPDPWRYETLKKIVDGLAEEGLTVVGLEGDPAETLSKAARHFGDRIAFIHVRDVEGDKTCFTELFHDQGTTDQFALMRTYRELGIDVPVRGDHVPEMEGDRLLSESCIPGYHTLCRLFANGYLKALLKGTGN